MDNMQLWLSSSTDSINLNDRAEGFYLNPDLEGLTGLPDIRSVNGLNAGYDGGWTATQLWAARLITIRGVIAINDKAAVEDKRKALAKILSQGKDEDLELKFVSEAGNTYTTTVRTSYCTMALQRVFWRQEYQIQLRANDPLIYDDGGSELIAILRVMSGEGGFEIPFDIPFDIGGTVTPTSIDVGDEATYPLIRLKGDLHNPTIISTTTNQRMQVLADIITTTEWRDYTSAYTTNGYKQIGDGLDGAPLSLTNLYGNATQETLSGKNLLPPPEDFTQTINGVSIKCENGVYTFSGTSTANGSTGFKTTIEEYTIQSGDYWHYDNTLVSSQVNVAMRFTDDTNGAFSMSTANRISSLESYVGKTIKAIHVNFSGGYTFNGTASPMILHNISTQTSYEPYVGGVPMPNPQFPSDVNVVSGAQTVKITGKNLIYNHLPTTSTSGGITITSNSDGSIIATGTATGIAAALVQDQNQSIDYPAGTYTLSVSQMPSAHGELRVNTYLPTDLLSSYQQFSAQVGANKLTFTTDRTLRFRTSLIVARSGYTLSNFEIDNLMLEFGSTPTSYEPYQSQSYEINLGKNLACIETSATKTIGGVPFTIEDGIIKISSGTTAGYSNFYFDSFRVQSGESQFWMEVSGYTPAPSDNCTYVLQESTDGGSTWTNTAQMAFSNSTVQHPTLDSSKLYRIRWYAPPSVSFSNAQIKFMLEYGSTKTSFAPYKTPIELAKIGNYQDYIWKDGDTWKIHREVGKLTLNGSETWVIANTRTASWYYCVRNLHLGITATPQIISNYGSYGAISNNNTVQGMIIQMANNNELRIRYFAEDTVDNWKAKLSSDNMLVYYILPTPTDTEITDSELIEQLNHIYSLYGGQNNLWLIPSGGAQGEMTVSYATAVDRDYHEVVIDCQARTVTQDGRNLYPALADGSEFIRLLPGENKLYLTSEVESDDGTAEVKFKKGNISI